MSGTTPDRTISGLTPRKRPTASNLLKQNRATVPGAEGPAPATDSASTPAPEVAATPEPSREPTTTKPTRARASRTAKKRTPKQGKVQIAVDVSADARAGARAAWRAAAYFEGVPTFSQFVENALRAEVRRIEKTYNDGRELEPITENLPSGRPSGA